MIASITIIPHMPKDRVTDRFGLGDPKFSGAMLVANLIAANCVVLRTQTCMSLLETRALSSSTSG
jgi:hypothetical protein